MLRTTTFAAAILLLFSSEAIWADEVVKTAEEAIYADEVVNPDTIRRAAKLANVAASVRRMWKLDSDRDETGLEVTFPTGSIPASISLKPIDGAQVFLDGRPVPLYFYSTSEKTINFQIPVGLPSGSSGVVTEHTDGTKVFPVNVILGNSSSSDVFSLFYSSYSESDSKTLAPKFAMATWALSFSPTNEQEASWTLRIMRIGDHRLADAVLPLLKTPPFTVSLQYRMANSPTLTTLEFDPFGHRGSKLCDTYAARTEILSIEATRKYSLTCHYSHVLSPSVRPFVPAKRQQQPVEVFAAPLSLRI